jgi:hypothetical protein
MRKVRLREVKLGTQGHTERKLGFGNRLFLLTLGTSVRKSTGRFFVVMEQFCILIVVMILQVYKCDKIT